MGHGWTAASIGEDPREFSFAGFFACAELALKINLALSRNLIPANERQSPIQGLLV